MPDLETSTQPTAPVQNQPETGTPAPSTEISSLARMRAAQQASAPAATGPDAGQAVPNGQSQNAQQRSEYIPRERFDQVNERLRQAEAQLAARNVHTGMQPVAQVAPQRTTMTGMVQPTQGQAIADSPQVQGLLARLGDKQVQEEWRKKIANSPVTGLAEFVQFAIQTEGAALLQQYLAPLHAQLAPLQQTFIGQQLSAYAAQRESDPTWQQVAPTFYQLASRAAQQGQALNGQVLSVVEAVARQSLGLPVFGAPAPAPAPFTERPGSGGQNFGSQPAPRLTSEQEAMARKFGMTAQEYAAAQASFRRA